MLEKGPEEVLAKPTRGVAKAGRITVSAKSDIESRKY
jgi:hypothetical protein